MTRDEARAELLRRAVQNAKQWSNHVEIETLCALGEIYPIARDAWAVSIALLKAMFPEGRLVTGEGKTGVIRYVRPLPVPLVVVMIAVPCPLECQNGCTTCTETIDAGTARLIDPGEGPEGEPP